MILKKFLKLIYDEEGNFTKSVLIDAEYFNDIFKELKEKSFEIEKIYEKIRNQEFNVY